MLAQAQPPWDAHATHPLNSKPVLVRHWQLNFPFPTVRFTLMGAEMDPKLQVDRLHVSAPQGNQTGRHRSPGLAVCAAVFIWLIGGPLAGVGHEDGGSALKRFRSTLFCTASDSFRNEPPPASG